MSLMRSETAAKMTGCEWAKTLRGGRNMLTAHSTRFRVVLLPLLAIVAVIGHALAAAPQSGREPRGPVTGTAVPRTRPGDRARAVPRDPDRWHPSSAYFLVAPIDSGSTYLLDDQLRVVNEWRSDYGPGLSAYLLDDGRLLRTATIGTRNFPGGNGGRIELFTWDGALEWSVEYATDSVQQHHDAIVLPNGHVLAVAWETRTVAEALDAGRSPETLAPDPEIWSDTIVEIDPQTGATTWIWRVWDHLVPKGDRPADHPGLIDPNFAAVPSADWTHVNSVAYNADLDQVLISVRNHSEIWIIDHGTSSEEAGGHAGGRRGRGGDLLYRWGNPAAYGATRRQQLFGQHNAQWIPAGSPGAGHILLFNNGDVSARPWSNAVEIIPPLREDGLYALDSSAGFGPSEPVWQYAADPPDSLFGSYASGVQRLASGGTLIAVTSTGRFREVDDGGQLIAEYQLASNGTPLRVFRVTSIPPTSPAFARRPLVATGATLGQILYPQ